MQTDTLYRLYRGIMGGTGELYILIIFSIIFVPDVRVVHADIKK